MGKKRIELFTEVEQNPFFDLIVIGGGATGLWCALDATVRGLRTLLLEKNDFAGETSSRSTKLLHGGLRYVKQGHLFLVHEALYERGLLAKNAADFVVKRPFIVPYYSKKDRFIYNLGLWLYDTLSGKKKIESYRILHRDEVVEACPTVVLENLLGGGLYYDLQFDDARFAVELAKQIWQRKGYAFNYCPAVSFIKEYGKIKGVVAQDKESGKEYHFYAKGVVNAAGVFVDNIRALDDPAAPKILTYSRGSHIVLPSRFLPKETALVVPKTKDNRIVFIIPWLDKVLLGTTDIKIEKAIENPEPTEEEIDFLLELAGEYLVIKPTREDVLSKFAGIRPLVRKSSVKETAKLARTHQLFVSPANLLTIAGGKWTTARHMAEETIDRFISLVSLPYKKSLTHTIFFSKPLPKGNAEYLDPSFPYTVEDLQMAVQEEMALHLSDFLARRTRILFLDAKKSIELAPRVARLMASYSKRDEAWITQEVEAFYAYAKPYTL